jgi:glucose/mannose transport system substrate-binding protein
VPSANFDVCGQTSMADLVEATDAGTLFGSLAHGHGQPASVQAAYLDVVTQFANSDMTPAAAAEALVASVGGAL